MHSFVVDAGNFDVVLVQGADSERFLQGQLTCDVAALADGHCIRGACCNNKGRVIAAFDLVRHQNGFYLCMAHGVGKLLADNLRKFIPFYKCTMSVLPASQPLTALAGDCATRLLHEHGQEALQAGCVAGTSSGWLCLLDSAIPRLLHWSDGSSGNVPGEAGVSTATLADWEAWGILQGAYPFNAEDSGLFTPQDLHMDRNGYVSFTKGCYTGQEIVARMHYRGKQKRQLYLAVTDKSASLGIGQHPPVLDANGTQVGQCMLTRSSHDFHFALLELAGDFPAPMKGFSFAGTSVIEACLFDLSAINAANLHEVRKSMHPAEGSLL